MTATRIATRVLLIEDDPAWAGLTREAFVEAAPEARLEILTSGDEAVARLAGGDLPDVVLLDLNMPGTDGRDVLRAIRTLPDAPDIEIIVLSASVSAHDRALATELGAAAYANKPTTFAALCRLAGAVVSGALDELESDQRPIRPQPVDRPTAPAPVAPSTTVLRVALVTGGDPSIVSRLSEAGLEVREVPSIDDLATFDLASVDCVLVDLDGPGVRRHEALRSAVVSAAGTPVVAIIGSTSEAAELASLASGATDVVPADVATPEVLRRTVRFAVERAALGRALEWQRSFFDAVLDNVDAGIVACDAEGRVQIRNRAARLLDGGRVVHPGSSDPWAVPVNVLGVGDDATAPEDRPLIRALAGEVNDEVELASTDATGEMRRCVVHGQPLRSPEGEKLGAVVVCLDVTEQRQAETALTHQALHDSLTGLPNRSLALDRIRHALERGARERTPTAVLFLDIDGFKAVNDTIGHAAGDLLLQTIADRLLVAVRTEDTVARLGGDEFLVISEQVPDLAAAEVLAERIHTTLSKPLPIAGTVLEPTCSIGIVVASASTGIDQVLQDADAAMYEAKRRGRARSQVFTSDLGDATRDRLVLTQGLRDAIRHDRLRMAYQPFVDLRTGKTAGFEALARWTHPVLGEVGPATFVQVAESSPDLTRRLGEWAVRTACEGMAGRQDLQVHVNLSARHLLVPDMADTLLKIISNAQMAPERLCLELTETAVIEATRSARLALERLKEAGVSLAMDDFGTGYASLVHLRDFPIDVLKIDRSFIAGMLRSEEDDAVVAGVIGLARGLGMLTIAEGVETAAQRDRLYVLGCTYGQGHFFAKPAPIEELPTS